MPIVARQPGARSDLYTPIRGDLAYRVASTASFQFDAEEALIIETDLPARRPSWNIS